MFQVFKRMTAGLEGLYGRKKVKDGRVAEVWRTQLGVAFAIFD